MWCGQTRIGSTFSTTLARKAPCCFISEYGTFLLTPTFCVSCQNWPFLHSNTVPEDSWSWQRFKNRSRCSSRARRARSVSVIHNYNLRGSCCSREQLDRGCATNPCELPTLPTCSVQEEFVFACQKKTWASKRHNSTISLKKYMWWPKKQPQCRQKPFQRIQCSSECAAPDMGTATCDKTWDGGLPAVPPACTARWSPSQLVPSHTFVGLLWRHCQWGTTGLPSPPGNGGKPVFCQIKRGLCWLKTLVSLCIHFKWLLRGCLPLQMELLPLFRLKK